MKPWNLYKYQKSLDYKTNIVDYDWCVKVIHEEKTIYVFTQFSTSILDWIVNFLFFLIPQIRRWYLYFAALGWQSAFNSCKGMILNEVQSGIKPDLTTWGAPKPLVFIISKIICRLFFGEVKQYAHRSDLISYMPPLPGYWNIKVIRIGKFSLKGLFQPNIYHQCYDDETLYREIGE